MKKSTVRLLARSARPVCIARTTTNAGHVLSVCADALISGWEFDYSAYVGDALDRLADAKVLTR